MRSVCGAEAAELGVWRLILTVELKVLKGQDPLLGTSGRARRAEMRSTFAILSR